MVRKNVTTINLSGETAVQFDKGYNCFFVNNLSGDDVLISMSSGITEGSDGVIIVPDGSSAGTMHGYSADTVYVKGTGKVQVMGTYSAFNPFKKARKGGEIKTATGSNITIANSVDFPLLALTAYGRSWQGERVVNVSNVGITGYGIPVSSGGNYTDSSGQEWICDELIVNENGTGKIINRIASVELDGVINKVIGYVPDRPIVTVSLKNCKSYSTQQIADIYCNCFEAASASLIYNGNVGAAINQTSLWLNIDNTISDVESANLWLNDNPITVIYPLAASTETELTAEQLAVLQLLIDKYGVFTAYFMSTQDGTPTPENPVNIVSAADLYRVSVPIESIGDSGSLTITTCGKNLLSYAESGVKTRNGLTVESFGNGEYHVYGTVTASATLIKFPLMIPSFIPDAKIHLSLNNTSAYSNIASIAFADTDGNEIGKLGINAVNRVHTTSTYNGKTIAAVSFYVANGNSVDYYIKPQFEIGTATEYEHYKSTEAKITTGLPLRGIPVSSGGNYIDSCGQEWICDTLEHDYTSAVKKQRIAVIDSYNVEAVGNNYISTTGGLTVGATVIYPAEAVTETALTADELAQLRNLVSFDGVTNINNSESAEMSVKYLTSKAVSKVVMPIITALRSDTNA